MTYRLFYSPGACSMAPHIVLEEIGVPFELELVSSRGERDGAMTATAQWRAINPKARVPALLGVAGSIGGAANLLTEAPAIMTYLAMRYPDAGLLPSDPASAARCFEWLNWLSGNVHSMSFGQIWRSHRFTTDAGSLAAVQEQGRRSLVDQYAFIEQLLGDGREQAIPQGYSIVDPYLLVFFLWGQRIGLEMRRDYPSWAQATERTLARPAVQRALEKEGVALS